MRRQRNVMSRNNKSYPISRKSKKEPRPLICPTTFFSYIKIVRISTYDQTSRIGLGRYLNS